MGIQKRKDSDNWMAVVTVDGKRYRFSTGSHLKKEAENYLSEIRLAVKDGTFYDKYVSKAPAAAKTTLNDGLKWYMSSYISGRMQEKSSRGVQLTIQTFIDIIGNKPAIDVTMKDIENYKLTRLAAVKKSSVDRNLGAISGFFARMARYEIIPFNPVAGKIQYYHGTEPRTRTATPDEIKKILQAIDNIELKLITLIGLLTGIRLADICGLKTDNLDMDNQVIKFRMGKVSKDISLPMSDLLSGILARYVSKYDRKGQLFTMTSPQVSNTWRGICGALSIDPPLQFRDLRRSYASMLYNNSSADIKLVSELLGHSKIDISHRVYTKTDMDKKREAIESMPVGFLEGLV